MGSDTSWGLVDLICQRTGINPVEVEGPRALALGGTVEGRYAACLCIGSLLWPDGMLKAAAEAYGPHSQTIHPI